MTANTIDNRETWLRTATASLRPMFEQAGYPLPDAIRYSIGFTSSGRKGKTVGETWHGPASADGSFEIMIRADIADPVEVLTVLVRQLIHAALPPKKDSGRLYKSATLKIGLQGIMRKATPGPLLADRLNALAASLPPLPHARLDIGWRAVDRKKKQGTRMLQAKCEKVDEATGVPCGYLVRLSSKWRKVGAICPIHGPMELPAPEPSEEPDENEETPAASE